MLTRTLWGSCQSSVRELRSLVTCTVVWKPSRPFPDAENQCLDDEAVSASSMPAQQAEPSSATILPAPTGQSMSLRSGSHASNPQQHRSYSAVPTPLPYNQKPRDPQAPPQGQDPWADLAGQAGQSRPAPFNRPPAGFQQQGRPQDPPQRPPGALQQQAPPGKRDPWAELEGHAREMPRGSPPPGGFRGGFSGGFQGRSRELLNLKQRQAGIVSIMSSNNNTIITLSDTDGKVQSCISAGCLGFSNSRKSTTQAAEAVGEAMAEKARSLGFTTCEVNMKGMGFGKQRAVRALHGAGLMITAIREKTPVVHNGCRMPRKRRN